ncbi:ATP-grasp domain-containing protein [Roseibium sp. SCP14]|uniref:ATP-binding protein n=1 Tax=Roseibium sp. SCP14 TaxID=3141375 RepID=UPI003334FABF
MESSNQNVVLLVLGSQSWQAWISDFVAPTNSLSAVISCPADYEALVATVAQVKPSTVIFLSHHLTLNRDAGWARDLERELHLPVICQSSVAIELAYDKRLMAQLASRSPHVSPIPELTAQAARSLIQSGDCGVVMKKSSGTEGDGFAVAHDLSDLDDILSAHQESSGNWMLQPHIQGREVSVNLWRMGRSTHVLEAVEKGVTSMDGKHPCKRVRHCPAPPLTTTELQALNEAAAEIAVAAEIQGIAELEFILSEDRIYLLEINPRISATLRMNLLACQVNFTRLIELSGDQSEDRTVFVNASRFSAEFALPDTASGFKYAGKLSEGIWATTRVTMVANSLVELDSKAAVARAIIGLSNSNTAPLFNGIE